MYKYSYSLNKFNSAIHTLVTEEGDVRSRLLSAFKGPLACIEIDRLPQSARGIWLDVYKMATRYTARSRSEESCYSLYPNADRVLPGRYEATFHRIKNATGRKIAELIYKIWEILNDDYAKSSKS